MWTTAAYGVYLHPLSLALTISASDSFHLPLSGPVSAQPLYLPSLHLTAGGQGERDSDTSLWDRNYSSQEIFKDRVFD